MFVWYMSPLSGVFCPSPGTRHQKKHLLLLDFFVGDSVGMGRGKGKCICHCVVHSLHLCYMYAYNSAHRSVRVRVCCLSVYIVVQAWNNKKNLLVQHIPKKTHAYTYIRTHTQAKSLSVLYKYYIILNEYILYALCGLPCRISIMRQICKYDIKAH